MSEYIYKYIIVHFVCATIGLSTKLLNDRYLRVSDLLWSAIFGIFYMLSQFDELDKMIIDLRKEK